MKDIFEAIGFCIVGVLVAIIPLAWFAAMFLLPAIGFLWLMGWLK